jgi:protein-tyrosine phosphatase
MTLKPRPSRITQHLYVSDWRTAVSIDYQDLSANFNIGTVITIMHPEETDYYNIEREDFAGAEWIHIPLADEPDAPINCYFPRVSGIIQETQSAGKATLIHCMAGISRSVTLATAYLIISQQLDAGTALSKVRARRPQADPNDGFLQHLIGWANRSDIAEIWDDMSQPVTDCCSRAAPHTAPPSHVVHQNPCQEVQTATQSAWCPDVSGCLPSAQT